MWTELQMNEYAKILELHETLVLEAFYNEKLHTLSEIEQWVLERMKDEFDKDYVKSVYTLVTHPDRKVSLVD